MRIIIDLKNIQKGWFEIRDFSYFTGRLAEDLRRKYPDAELYAVLFSEESMEQYFKALENSFSRDHIKTACFYPEETEDKQEDKRIRELFECWYIGQFHADLLLIPKYEDINANPEDWLVAVETVRNPEEMSKEQMLSELAHLVRYRSDQYIRQLAYSIEDSTLFPGKRTVYIDMSNWVCVDIVTGIQRVVNGFTAGLLKLTEHMEGIDCAPVYFSAESHAFYYAFDNGNRFLRQSVENGSKMVQFTDGDILFIPDLCLDKIEIREEFLRRLKYRGIKVVSYLHDLFPIYYPECHGPLERTYFSKYLYSISELSGVIANSKTTLENYLCWRKDCNVDTPAGFFTDYVYLGSDILESLPSKGLPADFDEVMETVHSAITLLMVGSIAPRKNHELMLDAMELLWKNGRDVNLVFFGNTGWNLEAFTERIMNYQNSHFKWVRGGSDEFLEQMYRNVDGVVYISDDEGYGLPVVEAAKFGKPLLLRNIPIFHEIAGNDATFYNGSRDPYLLANTLDKWIDDIENGNAVGSQNIRRYTWEECSEKCLKLLVR